MRSTAEHYLNKMKERSLLDQDFWTGYNIFINSEPKRLKKLRYRHSVSAIMTMVVGLGNAEGISSGRGGVL